MGWGPGPAKGGLLFQNMSSLWHHLQETPYQNQKILVDAKELKVLIWPSEHFEFETTGLIYSIFCMQERVGVQLKYTL